MDEALDDSFYSQKIDKATVNKLNPLIKEITRTPFKGIGKPEPLKENLAGFWSRRINLEHRLVYKVEGNALYILQCRYHY